MALHLFRKRLLQANARIDGKKHAIHTSAKNSLIIHNSELWNFGFVFVVTGIIFVSQKLFENAFRCAEILVHYAHEHALQQGRSYLLDYYCFDESKWYISLKQIIKIGRTFTAYQLRVAYSASLRFPSTSCTIYYS